LINRTAGTKLAALAAAFTLLSALGVVSLLAALGSDWSVYAPATCTATRCFCEFPRIGALILQPANSWSSYGYVFVGFLMITQSQSRFWNSRFQPAAASVFGITAIFVGLGSVLLHATLTLWGQFFDVMGMYLVSGFMLVSAIARWRNLKKLHVVILYLAFVGGLIIVLYLVPEVRRVLFAFVLLAAIILEMVFARLLRVDVKVSYYLIGIVTKAIAFTIWNLDQSGLVCAQQSLFQGHAIWHLLGATSLWFTFLYYRSERQTFG
jgi:dihydroceramidase